MSQPAVLEELATRCEKATGPDRDLDAEIFEAVNGVSAFRDSPGYSEGQTIRKRMQGLPEYTSSLDAAMSLVPDNWRVNWAGECPDRRWFYDLIARDQNAEIGRVWAATPAIALCVAALKSRATMETTNDH